MLADGKLDCSGICLSFSFSFLANDHALMETLKTIPMLFIYFIIIYLTISFLWKQRFTKNYSNMWNFSLKDF